MGVGSERASRWTPEGARVAVIGAGPAGCLLALALLDAARARRVPLRVTIFDDERGRSKAPLILDPPALARLASIGIPLPAEAAVPLAGVRAQIDGAHARTSIPLYTGGREGSLDFGAYLRAASLGRGAEICRRGVDAAVELADGGWHVRASGASMRFDLIALACGAGAPLASTLQQPPPLWRGCTAEVRLDPEARAALGGWATELKGRDGLPDLWVVPSGDRAKILAVDEDVRTARLAEAVCAAVCAGALPPGVELISIERTPLPAGAANPRVPTLGAALGGSPGVFGVAEVAAGAAALAAALLDGGPAAMLEASRREARVLDHAANRWRSTRRLWRRFPAPVIEHATRRQARRAPRQRRIERALHGGGEGFFSRLLIVVALFVAWLALRLRPLPEPRETFRGPVYVVDDDSEQAELITGFLQRRGIATRAYGDGLRAAADAAEERPAAMLLDVALPWLDGPTVARAIRRNSAVPIYLTTALPLALARAAAEPEAIAILPKPLDLEGLALRLATHDPPRPPQRKASWEEAEEERPSHGASS